MEVLIISGLVVATVICSIYLGLSIIGLATDISISRRRRGLFV